MQFGEEVSPHKSMLLSSTVVKYSLLVRGVVGSNPNKAINITHVDSVYHWSMIFSLITYFEEWSAKDKELFIHNRPTLSLIRIRIEIPRKKPTKSASLN